MSAVIGSLVLAGGLVLFLILAVLRRVEQSIEDNTSAQRVANDLAQRQAELEAQQRLQALRAEHAARERARHQPGQGHAAGNASLAGGCE